MGKKSRSWFSLVKRLFVSEPKSKSEKKSKRWRWVFGGLKPKQYPKLAAPSRMISEAREEQRKHAMAVAIATAAAAEAAVAAARAAAEVVRLTGVPQSSQEYVKWTRNLAATKIQAAYRAHLARKALKALKGLVRLQARVRGRIVRRQVITNLKSLPHTEKTQSQLVHEVRVPTVDGSCRENEKQFLSLKEELEEKKLKVFSNNMGKKSEPVITKCKESENWTKVTFKPDLAKFNMTHLEDDVVALMKKWVIDLAGCLGKTVKVELNGQRIPVKSFLDYVNLYLQFASKARPDALPRSLQIC